MQFEAAMQAFGLLHKQYGPILDGALLMFGRMLGFVSTGPIYNRKNIPFMLKIMSAFFFTGALLWLVPPDQHGPLSHNGQYGPYLLQLAMNIIVGALLGFMADMILQAVYAAGSLMTNQIGLSSAMLLDPSSGKQSMIMESLFGYLTTMLFIYLGGIQWMIVALKRSFSVFPLYTIQMPITQVIDITYLITLSGNILLIGVQLVSPIMIVTIAVDLMLGIVNRTAQQMPVFQLSFALKPSIGIAVLLLTLPTFLKAVINFLNDYSNIF
ncbi:MAG TPA: flagellar biosynthetic protein FliR [Coleofasciculaceae cyanobacterium]|jgi:flagellar biosynthetic protein FliR